MQTGEPSALPRGRERRSGNPGLAEMLSATARLLQAEPDLDTTMQAVVIVTKSNVPGAEHAGITTFDKARRPRTPVATDSLVDAVDEMQYSMREGPCLSALHSQSTMVSDDISNDERWPQFGPRAAELGVHSMASFHLFVHSGTVGALNLYATKRHAFSDASVALGRLIAAHAAIALVAARNAQQLKAALSTRDMIGQAKGILMERHSISADAAFGLLVKASQDSNRKLSEIAEMVSTTGRDPSGLRR